MHMKQKEGDLTSVIFQSRYCFKKCVKVNQILLSILDKYQEPLWGACEFEVFRNWLLQAVVTNGNVVERNDYYPFDGVNVLSFASSVCTIKLDTLLNVIR